MKSIDFYYLHPIDISNISIRTILMSSVHLLLSKRYP